VPRALLKQVCQRPDVNSGPGVFDYAVEVTSIYE